MGFRADLDADELIQPVGIRLDPAGLLKFVPSIPIRWIAHRDHADPGRPADPRASSMTCFTDSASSSGTW